MSTAAQRAREKAARVAVNRSKAAPDAVPAEAVEEDAAPLEVPRGATTTPVRSTIDLAPALHEEFDAYARDLVRRYGIKIRGGSARPAILRILVRRLLRDDDLGEQLRAEVLKTLHRES